MDDTLLVRRELTLDVAPDVLWSAISDPDELVRWLGTDGELAVHPHGQGWVRDDDGAVRRVFVEELEDGHRLAFRWWTDTEDADAERSDESLVTFTVVPDVIGTRLIVVEQPLGPVRASARASSRRADGWQARLDRLAEAVGLPVGVWA